MTEVAARSILTRSSGYLRTVCSHSLQPYRGCAYGNALCGVGCYVRHHGLLTRGQPWGSFLDARINAAALYQQTAARERAWARRTHGRFSIFCSSATDPLPPQEQRLGITAALLNAMALDPPDLLIFQTHSHFVGAQLARLQAVAARTALRVHLSIETDLERLPGLPPPASGVEPRFAAARQLKHAGIEVVITVAPLLPIADPERFFARIASAADAVVIDHFIGGDGSIDGSRTLRTALPAALRSIDPHSLELIYRDEMVAIAERYLPGRVGVGSDGFAGRYRAGSVA